VHVVTEEPQYPPTVPEPNASPSVAPASPSLAQTGSDVTLIAWVALTVLLVGIVLLVIGYRDRRTREEHLSVKDILDG
jgi:LPXTG-motif cell wall-anchored protein